MKLKHSIPFLVISLAAWPAYSQDFRRGESLYHDHCDVCHDSLSPPNQEKKLKSLKELRQRVESWGKHLGGELDSSDIEAIVFYLNQSYYHFNQKPKK